VEELASVIGRYFGGTPLHQLQKGPITFNGHEGLAATGCDDAAATRSELQVRRARRESGLKGHKAVRIEMRNVANPHDARGITPAMLQKALKSAKHRQVPRG
jgi:hypothetical protein